MFLLCAVFIFQGEASWTLPDSLQPATTTLASHPASARGSAVSTLVGGGAGANSTQQGAGWVSYIDEETGQLYWHNIHTGESRWDV